MLSLVHWFGAEWIRLYSTLHETDEDQDLRQMAEWIQRKGGSVTVREVQQGQRSCRTTEDAEALLNVLEKAGYGRWQDRPPGTQGGRPTRAFVVTAPFDVNVYETPSNVEKNGSCVDVDAGFDSDVVNVNRMLDEAVGEDDAGDGVGAEPW